MIKNGLIILGMAILFFSIYAVRAWVVSSSDDFLPLVDKGGFFTLHRLKTNPIIHHQMDDSLMTEAGLFGYVNINGPSLIRVPSWVEHPLGKYYLYFAHHKGGSIRLAYADDPSGPWR